MSQYWQLKMSPHSLLAFLLVSTLVSSSLQFDSLSSSQVENIKKKIRSVVKGSTLATVVRLSFHDCVGTGKNKRESGFIAIFYVFRRLWWVDIESLALFGCFRGIKQHLFGVFRDLKYARTFLEFSGTLNWLFFECGSAQPSLFFYSSGRPSAHSPTRPPTRWSSRKSAHLAL